MQQMPDVPGPCVAQDCMTAPAQTACYLQVLIASCRLLAAAMSNCADLDSILHLGTRDPVMHVDKDLFPRGR